MRRWILTAAACLGILSGCGDPNANAEYKTTEYVFGTLVEITIRGVPAAKAQAAVADLSAGFQRMHKDWHAWKGDGELMRVNAACKTGRPVEVDDFLLPLIRDAKTYYALSDGLFNAAVGEIVGAWGFHADEPPAAGTRPPFDRIRELAAQRPSMDDIVVDGHAVTCRNPAVGLDFGGFAKGAALDWALAELKSRGIANAVISAGGNVSTMGSHGDRPWRIGIRDPKKWGVVASLDVGADETVYTSGSYERFRDYDGTRYTHIVDPRTGMTVQHVVSATVVGSNGSLSDAASTAITVAGMADWPRIAKRMGFDKVLMVDEDGNLQATPEMAKRLIFPDGKPANLTIRPLD